MLTKFKNIMYSFVLVALCSLGASYFTHQGISSWYETSVKNAITPPNYYFPIAWNLIYFMMIISFFLILQKAKDFSISKAHKLFIAQLVLQIVWCFIFFAQGWLAGGLAVILLLDFVVFVMIRSFAKISKTAAYLLYPYFIWLVFASLLNLLFMMDNGMVVLGA